MHTVPRLLAVKLCLLALFAFSHPAYSQAVSAQEFEIIEKTHELLESGRLDAAEASARDFLETPNIGSESRHHVLNTLAFILYKKDDTAGALETYEKLLDQNGLDRKMRQQTTYTMAQLHVVREEHEDALKYLTAYMETVTPTAANYVLQAQIYYAMDRYADMIEPLDKAMELARESGTEIKQDWWTLLLFAGQKTKDAALIARANDAIIAGWPSEEQAGKAILSQLNLGDADLMSNAMQRYADRYPDGDRVTPLQVAVMASDADSVSQLIAAGANIDAMGEINRTPLHLAADFGLTSMVELLLSLGADTGSVNSNGESALWFAALRGDAAIFRMIWQAGGDVTYKLGETSVLQLMVAAGVAEIVNEILDANPSLIESEGDLALSLAASKGHPAVVRLLTERGASLDYRLEDGPTTLQEAVLSGDLETVLAILEAGARPDEAYDGRHSPLAIAALYGHIDIAQALIDVGADVDATNSVNRGALFEAAQKGHDDIVKILLDNGAAADALDTYGTSPLVAAASGHAWQSVSLLVGAGADFDRQYDNGVSIFSAAAGAGEDELVAMLLDAGADPNGGNEDQTALAHAIANNRPTTVKLLVAAGAETLGKDNKSSNALTAAVINEHPDVIDALIESGAVALEPAVFLEGWQTRDVAKLLKRNGFKRVGRGDVERWSWGKGDDAVSVDVRKQKDPYSIADVVRMVKESEIDLAKWLIAGGK